MEENHCRLRISKPRRTPTTPCFKIKLTLERNITWNISSDNEKFGIRLDNLDTRNGRRRQRIRNNKTEMGTTPSNLFEKSSKLKSRSCSSSAIYKTDSKKSDEWSSSPCRVKKVNGYLKQNIEPIHSDSRSKLSAISCPNVQHVNYGFEEGDEPRVPPIQHLPHCAKYLGQYVPFLTRNTFNVILIRDHLGLGLSVSGGSDSSEINPGLIRIKKIYPLGPADRAKLLQGDIIIKANGVGLVGMSGNEALDILRTTPKETILTICRPKINIFNDDPDPPKPANLNNYNEVKSKSMSSLVYNHNSVQSGEFQVILQKYNGSLGFTLLEQNGGHYVRALVKEPALSDGRIIPGDKIIRVNNTDITSMSHDDAINYLRSCTGWVKLELYREEEPFSPVLSPKVKSKQLRKEALDMLNEIAMKKLTTPENNKKLSPSTFPRKNGRRNIDNRPTKSTRNLNVTDYSFDQRSSGSGCSVESFQQHQHKPNYNMNLNEIGSEDYEDSPFKKDLGNKLYQSLRLEKSRVKLTKKLSLELERCAEDLEDSPVKEGLQKWKGISLGGKEPDAELEPEEEPQEEDDEVDESLLPPRRSPDGSESLDFENQDKKLITISLSRRWSSRLGFTLKNIDGSTYISQIYPDSVAGRDGRLSEGDQIIKVNNRDVEKLSTTEIIELMRTQRGMISISIIRVKMVE